MTSSLGTATAMLEVVLSAILGAYLQPSANRAVLPATNRKPPAQPRQQSRPRQPRAPPSQTSPLQVKSERPSRRPEMTDVDALGVADPHLTSKRLIDRKSTRLN